MITPDTWDLLVGRAVAARIRARILTNPKIHAPTLKVSYDGSKIVLEELSTTRRSSRSSRTSS